MGHGYDRYGPIGELNFGRAPFDPMVGSSPGPWLIRRTYAAHSGETITRETIMRETITRETLKGASQEQLSPDIGPCQGDRWCKDKRRFSLTRRWLHIAAAIQDCSISTSVIRLQQHLHIQTLTRDMIGYFLSRIFLLQSISHLLWTQKNNQHRQARQTVLF